MRGAAEILLRLAEVAQKVDELPQTGRISIDHAKSITKDLLEIITDYVKSEDDYIKAAGKILDSSRQLQMQNETLRRRNKELSFIAVEAVQEASGHNLTGNA